MFDLDLGKMVVFGGVALVVIGPKDLPAALRLAGRVVAQVRRVQRDIRKAADSLIADASIDREIAAIQAAARLDLARNPATAMRGALYEAPDVCDAATPYASPEMQAYLAPPQQETIAETVQEAG